MEFGEFNAAFLAAVRQAFDAGKTVDEAVAGLTLPEKFKDYGMQNAKDNVAKIYAELKSRSCDAREVTRRLLADVPHHTIERAPVCSWRSPRRPCP